MLQKSYESKNALYIIPTPIGNLKDITERALEILNSIDYILAEDTRTSSILLSHFNIKKSLIPCHKFNEESVKKKVIALLREGYNLGLITDQGTPLISDPGYLTVRAVIEQGFSVIALPGASAFLPALNVSGLSSEHFLFYGFLNSKPSIARKELESIKDVNYTIILYEAPHRLQSTLNLMLEILGDRNISISREITKIHEEVYRGNISREINELKNPKGEYVIIIEGKQEVNEVNIEEVLSDVKELISLGMSESNSIKYISSKNNISKNMLYNVYHRGEK